MRRIAVSSAVAVGSRVEELRLGERFGAVATRVRRGDEDLLASPELVLQPGDRVRVVAPREKLGDVAGFLGDSERGSHAVDPIGMGLGIGLGMIIGHIGIPGPFGSLMLGAAGGPLVMGLILGRLGKVGRVTFSLPYAASQSVQHLGILLFLATAGSAAGGQVAAAVAGGAWLPIFIGGAIVTTFSAVTLLLLLRTTQGLCGPRVAGILAAAQTQPAVLSAAVNRCAGDRRVAMGYALAYPAAMITKIMMAQIIALL
jgi:putative transport protein